MTKAMRQCAQGESTAMRIATCAVSLHVTRALAIALTLMPFGFSGDTLAAFLDLQFQVPIFAAAVSHERERHRFSRLGYS